MPNANCPWREADLATQEDLEATVRLAKAGTLKPLVLIYGDQPYLVKQAYDRLLEALVPADIRDFNLEQMDGTQVDVGQVLDGFNTLPMMPGNKVVGLTEARFFISKANAAELLKNAKERWVVGEQGLALRQLAKVLSLAEWTWEEGAAASDDQWSEALSLKSSEMDAVGGVWLREALASALNQGLEMKTGGDESGQLSDGLEASLALGGTGLYLVCVTASADARKKIFKLFHEKGHVLDFKNDAKGVQAAVTARAFFAQAIKQRGLTVKSSVAESMIGSYRDLGVLMRELDKMEAFAFPRKELTDEDRRAVGTPVAEDNTFELLDAFAKKDVGRALKVLKRQLLLGDGAEYQLFGMLSAEVRKLVLLRAMMDEGLLAAKGPTNGNTFKTTEHPRLAKSLPIGLAVYWKKTSPWALFYTMERAKPFSAAQLQSLLSHMAQLDRARVTGGISSGDALEEVVLRFCGVREEAIL